MSSSIQALWVWPVLVTAVVAQGAPEKVIKSTLCELLQAPGKFNGQMVELRAKFDTGMEFQGLLDETCHLRIWLEWPDTGPSESVPKGAKYAFIKSRTDLKRLSRLRWRSYPPAIRLVKNQAYAEFEAYVSKQYSPKEPNIICSCPLYEVTATFVGRFEFATVRAIRVGSGRVEVEPRIGFGHLNGWDAQLLVQSVGNVSAEPVKAWYTERIPAAYVPPIFPIPLPTFVPVWPPPPVDASPIKR